MKSAVAAISLLVCVALVHSVPLPGQSNINTNTNDNSNNNNSLYEFLLSLLQNTEDEPIEETPIYTSKPHVHHKPTKPCKKPVGPHDGEDEDEDDGSYHPETSTEYHHHHIHHTTPHHRPSGSAYGTANKNSNIATNTNVNAGAAEEEMADWGKVKRSPETVAAKSKTEATN